MRKRKILIIDDELAFGKMVKLNLEETGTYEVQTVSKGVNGLEAAMTFHPDLILLDVIMPDMDGPAVFRLLKEAPITREIPVVFLTAIVTSEETGSYGKLIGGRPFLAKPVTIESLVDCIQKNLAA